MKIKICGITSLQDACEAIEAGADMLGFNFFPQSPRYIFPGECAAILQKLGLKKESISTIGVFVNSSVAKIKAILEETGLGMAQLSGDEPVEDLAILGTIGFKAVRLPIPGGNHPLPTDSIQGYANSRGANAPAFLLDSFVIGSYGGTGKVTNWDQAALLSAKYAFLLAGGLTPENIAEAVSRVNPWGVDVASGVESMPGRKDSVKMKRFIQNARLAAKVIVSNGI